MEKKKKSEEGFYENIPYHIAIIPDGNRRWAERQGLEKIAGHMAGGDYNHVRELCKEASGLGVKYISFWGFSTENWKRNALEISALMDVVRRDLEALLNETDKYRFHHIGRKDRLPEDVVERIEKMEGREYGNADLTVVLALDYGGRDEISRAVNRALKDGVTSFDNETLGKYLDTAVLGIPDPDLIIRTGGEKRLSGFMPWQSVYSELYFTDVLFPDFNAEHLREALRDYSLRKRRFGGD